MKKKNLIQFFCSLFGISFAIFLSWFNGAVYENSAIIILSSIIGGVSGFWMVKTAIRFIKK